MSRLTSAIPSKGRLKEQTEAWLAGIGHPLRQIGGERGYTAEIAGLDAEVRLLSAREIAQGLIEGSLHFGVTGEDLLRESIADADKRILLIDNLGFGSANVVVAVPQAWIDVRTMADLDDVASTMRSRHGRKLRVATKYVNLTRRFFARHGLADYRIVESLGATEGAPAAPVPADVATRPEPLPGLPGAGDLLASEDAAWRELLPLWGMAVADGGDPCAQSLSERLQCYRTTRMTLHGLRQLDRPGVLSLRLPDGSGRVLLTRLDDDGAVLQIGERRWRVPLADLSAAWRGDYATVWRQPPGQQGRLSDGRTGAASRWLDERIAQLQVAGSVPASAATPGARLQAFQRAQGIDADGPAGPVTFMQINLASGVDEPRLLAPRS